MIRQFPVGFSPGVAPCHNGAIVSVGVSRMALPSPFSPGGQNGRLVSMSGPHGPWRRWRDSNSRKLLASPVFKTGAFDRSATSAYVAALRTAYEPDVQTANFLYGPSGETRTPDPMLPKHVRYQLRYTRIFFCSGGDYAARVFQIYFTNTGSSCSSILPVDSLDTDFIRFTRHTFFAAASAVCRMMFSSNMTFGSITPAFANTDFI